MWTAKRPVSAAECDVAILGAGPYGLAAAAHLHAANGLDIGVFGEPMSFWEQQMPQGMCLRSPYVASNIADPGRELTLDALREQTARSRSRSRSASSTSSTMAAGSAAVLPRSRSTQIAQVGSKRAFPART